MRSTSGFAVASLVLWATLVTGEISAKCGIKNSANSEITGKIVGGNEAEVGEYPWQVSLQFTGYYPFSHFCGGSLINESWVLTAAHCVQGLSHRDIAVKAGKHDLSKPERQERMTLVQRMIQHPEYDSAGASNDIALLHLLPPLRLGTYINVVCLPEVRQKTTGLVTVTGWGKTQESGLTSDVLMEVDVPVIPAAKCRLQYGDADIADTMLCAGYDEGRADACQGDSGGPLVAPNESSASYYLGGIVSWGDGCAHPNKSGVYTDVASFRDWIRQNTGI